MRVLSPRQLRLTILGLMLPLPFLPTSPIIAVATESVSGWATLNVDMVDLLITSGKFDAAVLGQFYSVTLTSEGASSPAWSVTAGALPDGLSLDGSTGFHGT